MKFWITTHGCKLNQFESSAIETRLARMGLKPSKGLNEAEVIIFNSCTVTDNADKKSFKFIRKVTRAKKPNSVFIVTGCLAQTEREKIYSTQGVDLVVDNNLKSKIPEILELYLKNGNFSPDIFQPSKMGRFEFEPESFSGRTRAFLKIQDGCNRLCSFCKVPFARGKSISLELDEIVKRFKKLLDLNYKEIVLTGVNITSYYWNTFTLKDLVKKLINIKGEFRIRLSSIMPDEFDPEILEFVKDGKVTPHLHISLQSGSDRIIKLMGRRYTSSDVLKLCESAKNYSEDFGFSGDVIVGFPGESEEDFSKTVSIVKEVGFFRLHIFPFSPRSGTLASTMPDQVPYETKKKREKILYGIVKETSLEFKKKFLGRKLRILPEEYRNGGVYGYADNYLRVFSKNLSLRRNEFEYVEITGLNEDDPTTVIS